MVDYNSKEWVPFLLGFSKADTVRKLAPFLLFMAVQALVVAVVILGIFHSGPNSGLRDSSIVHSLLGHVLALHYWVIPASIFIFTRWRAWK